jgi:hypothetical protein
MPELKTASAREICQAYRNVFTTGDGPKVLADILFCLGVFDDLPRMTPEASALKNYGSRLMIIVGGGAVNGSAVENLIKSLSGQPLPLERKIED